MTRNTFRLAVLLTLTSLTASCASTCLDFVSARPGFSTTKGQITRIDGLVTEKLQKLADGVAFEVTSGQCRVAVEFDDGEERVLELNHPDIVVCGVEADYILQPARDSKGGSAPR